MGASPAAHGRFRGTRCPEECGASRIRSGLARCDGHAGPGVRLGGDGDPGEGHPGRGSLGVVRGPRAVTASRKQSGAVGLTAFRPRRYLALVSA